MATIFNNYYNTITDKLNVPQWNKDFVTNYSDEVNNAIEKYSLHPSVIINKNDIANDDTFVIQNISSH